MSLPHEVEVIADIATKYRADLDAMERLHQSVVGMLTAGSWTLGKRGLDGVVVKTIVGLLTKACKTFRSIQILCERGLIDDADALVRVLMENTVAILFILQKKPRERARIYHAHTIAQGLRMLNDWKNTRGLKRKATKNVVKQVNDALTFWSRELPTGTDVQRHWSGRRNLREAVQALRGDVMYATLYRFTSSTIHASDFGAHVELEQATGDHTWQIEPRGQGFEAASYAACELLWSAANRIDQRLGLGFSALLAPHRVVKGNWVREPRS